MSATSTKNSKKKSNPSSDVEVEVLYQRLGDRWYAFSQVGDDVFIGRLGEDEEVDAAAITMKTGIEKDAA